jgi:hypothetical protein
MTDKQIRDEAMRQVMWECGITANDVTRYIADAVAEKVVRDEDGDGWIPVSERLPELDEAGYAYVMVCMDDEFVATTNYTRDEGFRLWAYSGEVVAWMPLPEPYKAE